MQDKHIEKLILEQLSRQNKLMIDKILPRLEALEDKAGLHNAALAELVHEATHLPKMQDQVRELRKRIGHVELLMTPPPQSH
jgi:hypothetical protein